MTPRLIFWRTFYFLANPFRRWYWRTFHPKTRGVKCLIERDGKFLLVRLAYAHRGWTLPGGRVDRGETFEQGAARELVEETGITVPKLEFIREYQSQAEGKQDTVQCFYGQSTCGDILTDPLEIADADWFERSQFPLDRSFRVDEIMGSYDTRKQL